MLAAAKFHVDNPLAFVHQAFIVRTDAIPKPCSVEIPSPMTALHSKPWTMFLMYYVPTQLVAFIKRDLWANNEVLLLTNIVHKTA